MVTQLREKYRPQTLEQLIGNATAKRRLAGILREPDRCNCILLHGKKGCGKTSAARILIRTLACVGDNRPIAAPCGFCATCINVKRSALVSGVSIIERNCATLTLADEISDFDTALYMHERVIIYYDEFFRARERLQDVLVTMVEDPDRKFVFIYSTPDIDDVDDALLQRSLAIKMSPPDPKEMVEHLRRICAAEGIVATPEVLAEICDRSSSVPRACLSMLEGLVLNADGAPLSIEHFA